MTVFPVSSEQIRFQILTRCKDGKIADIQDVIDFFADLDEFEKCITLKKIKDELGNEKSN